MQTRSVRRNTTKMSTFLCTETFLKTWNSSLENKNLQCRLATKQDVKTLTKLINEAYVVENFFKKTDRITEDQLLKTLDQPKDRVFVFESNQNNVIATVCLTITTHKSLFLGRLAVNPNLQGKGIGSRVIRFAENLAKHNHCKYVELFAAHLRPKLIEWYQKQGYSKVGTAPWPTEYLHVLKQDCHFIKMQKII